jgi:hypothetical protein
VLVPSSVAVFTHIVGAAALTSTGISTYPVGTGAPYHSMVKDLPPLAARGFTREG